MTGGNLGSYIQVSKNIGNNKIASQPSQSIN
jgi:hypothetical protein